MADLKAGTTIGGAGLWNASNLQFTPSGNSVAYRGFKVYTENDKPLPLEIGALANSGDVEFTGTMTMSKDISSAALRITGKNAGVELGNVSGTAGTPYIDFHTSGANTDYDLRLIARANMMELVTLGTAKFKLNMPDMNIIQFNQTGTTDIKGFGGDTFIRDYANGNVTISALRTSAGVSGDLYLGFNNTNSTQYTRSVRLESPMTWKGGTTLVTDAGKLSNAAFETAVYTQTEADSKFALKGGDTITGNLTVSGAITGGSLSITGTSVIGGVATFNNRIQANGTNGIMIGDVDSGFKGPADGIIQLVSNNANFITFDGRNVAGAGTMKVSGLQWAATNGKGYVDQWAQSGVVNVDFGTSATGYFNAFKAVHARSGQGYTTQIGLGIVRDGDNTWGKLSLFVGSNEAANGVKAAATLDVNGQFTSNSINSTGVINAIQSVLVNAPGAGDNVHLYLRNSDGATRAIVYAQPNNNLIFSTATGGNASLQGNGTFTTSGRLLAGGGTASLETDGNINGAAWGGYLSAWVNTNYYSRGEGNNAYSRADDAWNKAQDAQVNRVQWVRWGATNNFGAIGGEKWVDGGWVVIGLNSTGGQQNASINLIGGRIQVYKANGGWMDSSA